MDSKLELLLAPFVIVGLFGLLCRLDHHRNGVGVARLYSLLKQLALLLPVTALRSVLFCLLFEALEVVQLAILRGDRLLLLAEDLLVFAEEGYLVLQILDLTLRERPLLHILVPHALNLLVSLPDEELRLVELFLHSSFFSSDLVV